MPTTDLFAEQTGPFTEESDPFEITEDEELVVGAAGGRSCDVWVEVPEDWVEGAELALFGRAAKARSELGRVVLSEAKGTVESGVFKGVALRSRGQPCDGFELTVKWVGGGSAPDGTGKAQLQISNLESVARVEVKDTVRKEIPPAGTSGAPIFTQERIPDPTSTVNNPSTFKSTATTDCAFGVSVGWLLV